MKRVKDLFSHYIGTITEEPDRVTIRNVNTIIDHYGKPRQVECKVEVALLHTGYSAYAEEKTLEIMGGQGCGCMSLDEALKMAEENLKKYNFKKRKYEEVSLF